MDTSHDRVLKTIDLKCVSEKPLSGRPCSPTPATTLQRDEEIALRGTGCCVGMLKFPKLLSSICHKSAVKKQNIETEEEASMERKSSNGDRELECGEGGGKRRIMEGERVANTFPLIKINWSQVTISWSEYVWSIWSWGLRYAELELQPQRKGERGISHVILLLYTFPSSSPLLPAPVFRS